MGKKIAIALLAIINSALLVMVLISVITGWHIRTAFEDKNNIVSDRSSTVTDPKGDNDSNEDSDEKDKPEGDDSNEGDDDDNNFVPGVTAEEIPEDDEPAETEQSSAPEQSSTPEQSSAPERSSTPEQNSGFPAAGSVTTSDKAGLRDAEGYAWDKGWTYLSANAKPITDYSLLTGGWKATMITDPLELVDSYAADYFNISLSGSASSSNVTINWGLRIVKGTGTVDSSGTASTMTGSFSSGRLTAIGSGSITIEGFCYENGKEYAVGTYTWPDGVVGYVGLIRP